MQGDQEGGLHGEDGGAGDDGDVARGPRASSQNGVDALRAGQRQELERGGPHHAVCSAFLAASNSSRAKAMNSSADIGPLFAVACPTNTRSELASGAAVE